MNKKTKFSLMLLAACIAANESGFAKQVEQEFSSYTGKIDYLPYLQVGGTRFFNGGVSSGAIGTDLFLPIWQSSLSHLVFTQLRFYDRSGKPWEGNVHLGYRYLSHDETRLHGVYAAFDRKHTIFGNYFNQLTFGIETWFKNFFIGGNYYQPIDSRSKNTNIFDAEPYLQKLHDNVFRIMVTPDQHAERSAGGADIEIGYKITKRLIGYVGGYCFKTKDFNSVYGPKAKLSYDYSLDNGKRIFGILDKVGAEVGVQYDKPWGTVGYLNVRLQVGLLPYETSNLQGVARHMVDLVHRDVDIVTQEGSVGKGEPRAVRTQDGKEIRLFNSDGFNKGEEGPSVNKKDDVVYFFIGANSNNITTNDQRRSLHELVFSFLSPHTGKKMSIDLKPLITQSGSAFNPTKEDISSNKLSEHVNAPSHAATNSTELLKLDEDTAKKVLKYVSASSYAEGAGDTFLESTTVPGFRLVKIESAEVLRTISNSDKEVSKHLSVSPSGAIVDSNTGLRFVLLKDEINNEYILAFGSTESGKKYGEQDWVKRMQANIAQYLGWKPEIYSQAVNITKHIKSSYKINDTEITLTGSSLGGALAVYSATMNDLSAKGFATVAFNPTLRDDMRVKDTSKITSFITTGDWRAKPPIPYLHHVGTVYQMEPFGKMNNHAHSLYFIAKKAYPLINTTSNADAISYFNVANETSRSKIIGALYNKPYKSDYHGRWLSLTDWKIWCYNF